MDKGLRKQLLVLIKGGESHMHLSEAVADFPIERINELAPNVDYSPWYLLEHIRITQWDILEFIKNPKYKYLKWPDDYWPKDKKAIKKDWDKTIGQFEKDNEELQKIAKNTKVDLDQKIPWGDSENQTIMRELLMVADHNAYHIGEFAILRQVMGTWPKGHK